MPFPSVLVVQLLELWILLGLLWLVCVLVGMDTHWPSPSGYPPLCVTASKPISLWNNIYIYRYIYIE